MTPVRSEPWRLRFGAEVQPNGVSFRIWAPRLETVCIELQGPEPCCFPMTRDGEEFSALVPTVRAGVDYMFRTAEGTRLPDPVSRWQPSGVHAASRVVDPAAFAWSDAGWKGVALEDLIVYELHTGTFTPEGTFEAVISKLSHLQQLGITAIELMPVAEFPGGRNWGYDGVCLYAPQSSYGGPDGLKMLVDACHHQGLAVVLDVVYNHLGPEGNYLNVFAPFFNTAYRTPWGDALNFDGPDSDGVRRFFIQNALYWVTEFHVDALRLDAVHGIFDFSARHILEELATAVHEQAGQLGRRVHVIAESDLNDVRLIHSISQGGYGLDAQWLDEFHHALRALLVNSPLGYFSDFGKLSDLAKALTEGFVHDGGYSPHRRKHYGSSSRECPGRQFVAFSQNHDQIANASGGDRLSKLATFDQEKLAAAVLLCSPYLPLLFMGQEYGETAPFHYFTSFTDPQLAEAVREGRRHEFAAFAGHRPFADPQDPLTFEQSRLDWGRLETAQHASVLRLYRDLIALRKRLGCIANCRKELTRILYDETLRWMTMERRDAASGCVLLTCNFAAENREIPVPPNEGNRCLTLWTGAATYGGSPQEVSPPARLGREEPHISLPAWQAALYVSPAAG